ncbi:hypothetical protein F5Y18DRAFT_169912 [Xylariaceae sp. FL1019]|nr:hypothetical protein F5Y18DRAFT_169912 [Xylariaceae sp. FL1019]
MVHGSRLLQLTRLQPCPSSRPPTAPSLILNPEITALVFPAAMLVRSSSYTPRRTRNGLSCSVGMSLLLYTATPLFAIFDGTGSFVPSTKSAEASSYIGNCNVVGLIVILSQVEPHV